MLIDSHAHHMLPVEKQLALMAEAGVDKTILFSTTPHPEKAKDLVSFEREFLLLQNILSGICSVEERLNSIRRITLELCDVLKEYPHKFWGFGAIPLSMTNKETHRWLDEVIVANGLLGIGEVSVSPGQISLLDRIFESLAEYKRMPIWIHTFHPLTLDDLKELSGLARKYPSVPVIFGHMGGVHWLETVKLAKQQKNIYLDLSATFTTFAPKMAIKELPERTLFSSDAPYGNPLLMRKMIETICNDKSVEELVLGENIERLLTEGLA